MPWRPPQSDPWSDSQVAPCNRGHLVFVHLASTDRALQARTLLSAPLDCGVIGPAADDGPLAKPAAIAPDSINHSCAKTKRALSWT